MKLFHHKEKKMTDVATAQAAWQAARDAFNQACDDFASAANEAAQGDPAIKAAVQAAADALAPFNPPA